MSVNNNLYIESGELSAYDFFLKITNPEIAEKIEKLKLHEQGTFEREFWEDLELSKNTFPALRKISIKCKSFNLFNLKFFRNTQVKSFNFRDTAVNKLEYIAYLLQTGKRVIISDEKHVDTAKMAISHAIDTKDYTFLTLALQTGSWKSKNAENVARTLLDVATIQEHFELQQKWAEELVLQCDAPQCIKDAIASIKHPLITFKTIDGEEVTEVLLSLAYVMSNPVLSMFYNSQFCDKSKNCIEMQMSKDCLENLKALELNLELAEGIGTEALLEMAHIAEMYDWKALKDCLTEYKITAEWDEEEYADDYEKLEAILDLLPGIPEFMKQPVLDQAFEALDLDKIKVEKNKCTIAFHMTLIQILKKLPSSYDVNLSINMSDLDPSSMELLQASGPYNNISFIYVENSDDGLSGDCIKEKILHMIPSFPACKKLLMVLDFRSYPNGLENSIGDIDLAFILNINFAHLNVSNAQTLRMNAPYNKVKELILTNSDKNLPRLFIEQKKKELVSLFPNAKLSTY